MATDTRESRSAIAPPAPPDRGAERAASVAVGTSRPRAIPIVWAIATLALALFLGLGSVPMEAGRLAGRNRGVADTWERLGNALPEVGHATLLRVVFYGAVAATLLGVLLGLWLALRAGPEPTDPAPPSSPGSA